MHRHTHARTRTLHAAYPRDCTNTCKCVGRHAYTRKCKHAYARSLFSRLCCWFFSHLVSRTCTISLFLFFSFSLCHYPFINHALLLKTKQYYYYYYYYYFIIRIILLLLLLLLLMLLCNIICGYSLNICVYVYIYIYIYVCICVYIYIYIYIHTFLFPSI